MSDSIIAQLKAVIGLDTSDFSKGTDQAKKKMEELKATAVTLGTALTAAFTVPALGAAKVATEFVQMKQSAEIAFGVMLKNGDQAKKLFSDLQAFAASTPFDLPDVVKNTQRLTAMGFAAKDAIPLMRVLGDATAAVGGNGESLNRIALAIGQIRTAGTLKTQDLNQLVEAGLPVFDILSQKMHKSVSQIRDDLQKGAISSKQALDVILGGLDQRYGGVMEKMGATWKTTVSNLQDNASQALGTLFEPAIKGATSFVQMVTTQLGKARDYFAKLSDETRQKIVAVIAVLAGIGPAILAITGLSTAFAALLTPVGLVVTAVAAFGVAYATNLFGVRDVTNTVVGAIGTAMQKVGPYLMLAAQFAKVGWDAFVDAAKWAINFYAGIPAQIEAALKFVGSVVTSAFTSAYDGIKGAVNLIGQAFSKMAEFFQSGSGVMGGLGEVFGRVWQTISAMTANGVSTVVSLIASMLSELGKMTGATKLVEVVQDTAVALQSALGVVLMANQNKINALFGSIKGAVAGFKLPDWKGLSGGMPDAGESKDDKKARDKALKDAERHAKALADLRQQVADKTFALSHDEFEVMRRDLAKEAAEMRKAGVTQIEITKFVEAEKAHIKRLADESDAKQKATFAQKQLQTAAEAARKQIAALDDLQKANLITFDQEKAELLAGLGYTAMTNEMRVEIYRSGNQARIDLLKKYDEIDKKQGDEEAKRAKKLADLKAKYNYVPLPGGLGGAFVAKNWKPKPTDDEKYSAEATKKLNEALADAEAHYSKVINHADRYQEVLAALNLEMKKLTPAQQVLLAQVVAWDKATAKVEAYKKKLEQAKGELKGVFSSAFQGALEGSEKFFTGVEKGVKQLLVKIAAEWAANELVKVLFGMAGKKYDGLSKDAETARNSMIEGAASIAAASVSLTGAASAVAAASATMAAASAASAGAGAAGLGSGGAIGTAAGAGGASKLLGGGLSKTLGYVGIGLAADQMLFHGAISKTIVGGVKSVAKGIGKIFGFADGGRPPLNQPSIVGENGPELFWPDRSGTVTSHGDSRSILGGMGSGVHFHGPTTFNDQADVRRVQAIARAKTQQKLRLV